MIKLLRFFVLINQLNLIFKDASKHAAVVVFTRRQKRVFSAKQCLQTCQNAEHAFACVNKMPETVICVVKVGACHILVPILEMGRYVEYIAIYR